MMSEYMATISKMLKRYGRACAARDNKKKADLRDDLLLYIQRGVDCFQFDQSRRDAQIDAIRKDAEQKFEIAAAQRDQLATALHRLGMEKKSGSARKA